MKKVTKYLMMLLSLTLLLGFNACSSDDDDTPETELPNYMEEKIPMQIGSQTFMLSVFDNATGRAFKELLPLTISMEDVNANEKFYRLPQSLPGASANPGTIRNGDLMAYGGNGLVLFYKTFPTSYSYARIGTVDNPSGLQSAMGSGTVTISFGETIEVSDATLTYNTNGATGGPAPDPVTDKEGTSVRLNNGEGLSRTGFTFGGWNTNAEGTGTNYAGGSNYTLARSVILYARWIPEGAATNYTLTYHINGGTGSTPNSVTDEEGTTITLNNGSGISRSGYTFAGWNTAENGSGTDYAAGSSYTLTADITLYAKWTQVVNSNSMKITVGSNVFNATLASNATASAFKQLLPMTVSMTEHGGNEKFYGLPNALPTNASNPGTIQNGDLMLYGSSTFVMFYKTFSTSYSYTRIGSVDNPSGLQSALGGGSVTVTFELIP